jgi:hypothetical protein
VLAPRGMGGLGNVRLCSCLLALLATLLLLATAAGESPYQALRLVGYSSDGVLSSLDSLPSLVGYLARSILCSSALLLLLFLVLLLLLRLA